MGQKVYSTEGVEAITVADNGNVGVKTSTFTKRGKVNFNVETSTLTTAVTNLGQNSQFFCASTQVANVNNSSIDIFRFYDAQGAILGSNGLSGFFYINIIGSTGLHAFAGVYAVTTTGNGTSSASFASVTTAIRGTNPIISVNIVNDGAGGQIKLQATYTNNSGVVTGGYTYVSFSGQIFE